MIASGRAVFLVDELPPPGPFVLDGPEGRHAATVKRLGPGERLILADGRGSHADATVREAGRHHLGLDVARAEFDAPPALQVTVVQALPKGERSDMAVDLATQAGADEIIPWQAERCIARWTAAADKAARGRAKWQATARAAAKQSRRSRIPAIGELARLPDIIALIAAADATLVLHEAGSRPLAAVPLPPAGRLVLIIGPEGGIAPAEIDAFGDAGAQIVRLGPEVLRCSAAAAVALGAIGVRTDRWAT